MNCSHDMELFGWFVSKPESRVIFSCTKCGSMCRASFAATTREVIWNTHPEDNWINPPHPDEYISIFGDYNNGK